MDKKEALELIKKDYYNFHKLPVHFKKDKEFVLEAIKLIGNTLCEVDDSLKKDKELEQKVAGQTANIEEIKQFLLRNNYQLMRRWGGWVVIEPLGARTKLRNNEALCAYAAGRGQFL